ncbi:hypothetical protein C8R44DRAFT_889832 [Mycena epipterygia]|nr:hypothetical protein C8R44DRAFT_889832 [Mycena epipterygia]
MSSLTDLPTELLVHIAEYYPDLLLDIDVLVHGAAGSIPPMLWERVHACFTSRNRHLGKIKTREKMLERRMRGTEKTPYVVPYIYSLSIIMEECDLYKWQPIHKPRSPTMLSTTHQRVVHVKGFPSVMALALSDDMAPIVHCFPNVQTLTYHYAGSNRLLNAYKGNTQIHTINNIALSSDVAKRLHEAVPRLKCLSVWRDDTIHLLEGLDNLSDLRIRCPSTFLPDALEEIITTSRQVLWSSNAQGPKELRVQILKPTTMRRSNGRRGTDDIIEGETQLFVIGGS